MEPFLEAGQQTLGLIVGKVSVPLSQLHSPVLATHRNCGYDHEARTLHLPPLPVVFTLMIAILHQLKACAMGEISTKDTLITVAAVGVAGKVLLKILSCKCNTSDKETTSLSRIERVHAHVEARKKK